MVGSPVNVAWNLRDITPDGILGNPEIASADRGEVLMKLIVDEVSEFLVDFNNWDWSKPNEI